MTSLPRGILFIFRLIAPCPGRRASTSDPNHETGTAAEPQEGQCTHIYFRRPSPSSRVQARLRSVNAPNVAHSPWLVQWGASVPDMVRSTGLAALVADSDDGVPRDAPAGLLASGGGLGGGAAGFPPPDSDA